jgi:hypothetical protein
MGGSLSRVALGTGLRVTDLGAGTDRSCALLTGAVVKCWGDNSESLLGLGDTRDRGGDIGGMGDALPAVNLGW